MTINAKICGITSNWLLIFSTFELGGWVQLACVSNDQTTEGDQTV